MPSHRTGKTVHVIFTESSQQFESSVMIMSNGCNLANDLLHVQLGFHIYDYWSEFDDVLIND